MSDVESLDADSLDSETGEKVVNRPALLKLTSLIDTISDPQVRLFGTRAWWIAALDAIESSGLGQTFTDHFHMYFQISKHRDCSLATAVISMVFDT